MPIHYLYLLVAVVTETIGTASMQASEQFTRFWPSVLLIVAYGVSFYFLSLTLRYMQVSIVYAIWSGLGIVLIGIIGWMFFKQSLDFAAILGMALIVAGVVVINMFSNSATH
ncbi:QacE family quaternary ammonium compound efflux SMR transporter [Rhodobacterales bacterium 52_120_T64]|nr:QacE family quaternary ammonium compound efflux SMR transporter [Rhodobacterales bacterium 52_120_T64]